MDDYVTCKMVCNIFTSHEKFSSTSQSLISDIILFMSFSVYELAKSTHLFLEAKFSTLKSFVVVVTDSNHSLCIF